jgi:hypothetical protein
MAKRQLLEFALQRDSATAPQRDSAPRPAEPAVLHKKPAKARTYPLHVSVYISDSVYREIRRAAVDLNCKPHDLLIEGVNLMLQRHGRGTIEEIDARNSAIAQATSGASREERALLPMPLKADEPLPVPRWGLCPATIGLK